MISRRRVLAASGLLGVTAAVGCGITEEHAVRITQHHSSQGRRVPEALGEWWVPEGRGPAPTVVLVHGGYWQPGFNRHLEDDLAADLCSRGYLVWNIDYRPASDRWPAPLASAAAAYDHLTVGKFSERVDRRRVAVVGHSAGGQLALWLASRHQLPPGAPGAMKSSWLRPALAVGQAPVAALVAAADERLGGGAVNELCGGTPDAVPDRYAVADPSQLVPAWCPVVVIHGRDDEIVPLSQSRRYEAAAYAVHADTQLYIVPGGHFEHLESTSAACRRLRMTLNERLRAAVTPHLERLPR